MPTLIKGKIGREYFTQSGRGWGQVLKSSVYLVCLVCLVLLVLLVGLVGLVHLVYLVYLVYLVGLVLLVYLVHLVGLEGEGGGVFFSFHIDYHKIGKIFKDG